MDSYITKLPKELLALIFEHLTKANDRRRAAQVCKLFYDIIRHQSTLKRDNMLRMKGSDSETSPIRVFEKLEWFPFSKLNIKNWRWNVVFESDFWTLHGHKISELMIDEIGAANEILLSNLSDYFPNLKKLTIKGRFSKAFDADHISQPTSLSIEDLNLDTWTMSLEKILNLLRCSPLLKNLEMERINADYLPQILPWLETIENSRLRFGEIPLEKLINLPSKVVIDALRIQVNETPEKIREFFKQPRMIETLSIQTKTSRFAFNYNNPVAYFNRDKAMALGGAKSIKQIRLLYGVLEFEGSLDLLARLPGLESISIEFEEDLPISLYPFYWSLPETAQKIREIYQRDSSNLDYLAGLSNLTSISILSSDCMTPCGLSNVEIQFLIRNCPNLRKLFVPRIDATDADLIGNGDLLPISFLKKLESLDITHAPKITPEAFKSAFKFPNLKYLALWKYPFEEKPFNQHVANQFTQNCPNLKYLTIYNCPITWEGFDYLIRHLPYLRRINIQPKGERYSLNKDQVAKLQKEFPYIYISRVT